MAAEHTPDNLPPELIGLIADKQAEAKEAQSFGWSGALVKTALGGVAGMFAGAAVYVGTLVNKTIQAIQNKSGSLEQFVHEIEKLPPEAKDSAIHKVAEDMVRSAEGITGAIIRNPNTAVLVGAGVGAGYALSNHAHSRTEQKNKAEGELSALNSTAQKWQDRVKQAEVVQGPESHAIH